ncbi:MAG TPA: hypothetical protein VHB99_19670 [Pirellulales bacterium]|nr:hypothetical protein [Pirellulales bacterium]
MMDDANPYAAPQDEPIDVPVASDEPQSVAEAMRHGAWAGFKWGTYIVASPIVLLLLLGLAEAASEWSLNGKFPGYFLFDTLGSAAGVYAIGCTWGVIVDVFGAVLR